MSTTVTINNEYKIEIPQDVRNVLSLRPGDELLMEIDGIKVVLRRKPKSYAKHLRGLHKEVWEGIDATEYVKRERERIGSSDGKN